MNKHRPGFAFELAVIFVILIGTAIIALIVMFYNSSNQEVPFELPQELLSNNETVKPKNSYLDTLEIYRDKENDVLPREVIQIEGKTNLIERGNQEGKNSIYKTIDSIVEESGAQ